jgi:AcrR family transcriptional regulator
MKAMDREAVRRDLLNKGRELFAQGGLRGTSVQDLTQAVGIAQGSFYSFFAAKEELFFEILEQEETAIVHKVVERLREQELTRTHLRTVIKWSIELLRSNPILYIILDPVEYQRLLRKIPVEHLQSHMQNEQDLLAEVLSDLQTDGRIAAIEHEEMLGLFHALFVTTLHQDEIGVDVFPRVLDRLISLVADHVATQGERNIQLGSRY